jgi:hypothetical protein
VLAIAERIGTIKVLQDISVFVILFLETIRDDGSQAFLFIDGTI